MSLSLYFTPVTPPPPGTSLGGHPVKGLLLDAFGVTDEGVDTEWVLDAGDVPVLEALRRVEAAHLERLVHAADARSEPPGRDLQITSARECFEALTELLGALRKHPDGLRLYLAD